MTTIRTATTFEGQDLPFRWTNDEWAQQFLPHIRAATASLSKNDRELQEIMEKIAGDGLAPQLLQDWCETRDHLTHLCRFLDVALARSGFVLERHGYDLNKLPDSVRRSVGCEPPRKRIVPQKPRRRPWWRSVWSQVKRLP
jgi:hypothetical protein